MPPVDPNSTNPAPQEQPAQPVMPVAEAVTPPPPVAPPVAAAPVGTAGPVSYTSNPFLLLIKSFGNLLQLNGAQALLLGMRIILVCLALGLIAGVFALIHVPIVFAILIIVLYVYAILASVSAIAVIGGETAKGNSPKASEMFGETNRRLLPMLGLIILLDIIVFIGTILLIVPGLLFAGWFMLAPFVMVAENLGIIASLKRSKELTSGHVFEMYGMLFATTILSGNGLLSFLTAPAGFAGRYQELRALKESGQPKPAVHWSNYVMPIVGFIFIVIYAALVAIVGIQNKNNNAADPYGLTPSSTIQDNNASQ